MDVTGTTTMLATFGNPNKGNPAPAAYNAAFAAMEVDYVYLACEPDNIGDAMAAVRALGCGGGTITKPFKLDVREYLDEIDDDAQRIGAVNVVVNDNGKLIGHNSDWAGAMDALTSHVGIANKKVALLGAGGAARAVAFGLQRNGVSAALFNRSQEKGREVADHFGHIYTGSLEDVSPDFDIIINATSIGSMGQENEIPVNPVVLSSRPVVFDIVSKPALTRFVETAREANCQTISGGMMVAHQALYALEWLTGVRPPLDVLLSHFA